MLSAVSYIIEKLFILLTEFPAYSAQHYIRKPYYRSKGSPQFMAHVSQELALGTVCALCSQFCLQQFFFSFFAFRKVNETFYKVFIFPYFYRDNTLQDGKRFPFSVEKHPFRLIYGLLEVCYRTFPFLNRANELMTDVSCEPVPWKSYCFYCCWIRIYNFVRGGIYKQDTAKCIVYYFFEPFPAFTFIFFSFFTCGYIPCNTLYFSFLKAQEGRADLHINNLSILLPKFHFKTCTPVFEGCFQGISNCR